MSAVRNYALVTAAYWAFTLTDGALRMLVLLHFHNGMIVPLPFRDARAMKRLDPLIALGRSAAADAPYLAEFPPIDRSVEGYADVRQVTFAGNKLVVSERWHPELSAQAIESFSPWQTTSSLTGIEFVEANAYYRQFLPTADVRPGFEIFRHNCQFCHGVNKVGASYGWDYATPLPLHTYRSNPERLYMHIHYRVEYKATWQKMPALKHVTESEAALLWQWMRAASSAPTPMAAPPHWAGAAPTTARPSWPRAAWHCGASRPGAAPLRQPHGAPRRWAVHSSWSGTPTPAPTPAWFERTNAAICASIYGAVPGARSCRPSTSPPGLCQGSRTIRPSSSCRASSNTWLTPRRRRPNSDEWQVRRITSSSYSSTPGRSPHRSIRGPGGRAV